MLSSKHGLAEYNRAQTSAQNHSQSKTGSSHPKSKSQSKSQSQAQAQSQSRTASRPATHSSSYGASQPHRGAHNTSSSSPVPRGGMEQEMMTETTPIDILSFLKNYNPHELAALYHRWGSANPMLDPTGKGRG